MRKTLLHSSFHADNVLYVAQFSSCVFPLDGANTKYILITHILKQSKIPFLTLQEAHIQRF